MLLVRTLIIKKTKGPKFLLIYREISAACFHVQLQQIVLESLQGESARYDVDDLTRLWGSASLSVLANAHKRC
jgi:hypothetical protein